MIIKFGRYDIITAQLFDPPLQFWWAEMLREGKYPWGVWGTDELSMNIWDPSAKNCSRRFTTALILLLRFR